jgi:hypothetical protein
MVHIFRIGIELPVAAFASTSLQLLPFRPAFSIRISPPAAFSLPLRRLGILG